MTQENQPNKPVSTEPNLAFGTEFIAARKKKIMSVDDVAKELYILKRHVEAIEAEDFEALPQKVFARGFVVNYAKLVGLDSDEMVRRFEARYPAHLKQDDVSEIKTPLNPIGTLKRGQHAPMRLNVGLIMGVIAVGVFVVLVLKMVNGATSVTSVNPEPQVADSLSMSEQAQGAEINSAVATPDTLATPTPTATVASANEAVLDFWVRSGTKITVIDAQGQSLMAGEQKRGSYQLKGYPPFQIEVEEPKNITLNYNQDRVAVNERVFTVQ